MASAKKITNIAENKQDAKAKEVVVVKKKRSGAVGGLLIIIIGLALAVWMKTAFILVIIWMLPALIAYYVDLSDNRYYFLCVATCNITGALPYIAEIMMSGNTSVAFIRAIKPEHFFNIYLAAFAGYVGIWVFPHVAEILIEYSTNNKIARLHNSQQKLLEEWGGEIDA